MVVVSSVLVFLPRVEREPVAERNAPTAFPKTIHGASPPEELSSRSMFLLLNIGGTCSCFREKVAHMVGHLPVPQSGLIIAEALTMSNMSDEPHVTAGVSLHSSQELRALRQTFLESLNHFIQDVRRFSHEWQTRWNDPLMTQSLAEISEALLITLAGLETEFSQPEGPS